MEKCRENFKSRECKKRGMTHYLRKTGREPSYYLEHSSLERCVFPTALKEKGEKGL